jgi:hypothetical protein
MKKFLLFSTPPASAPGKSPEKGTENTQSPCACAQKGTVIMQKNAASVQSMTRDLEKLSVPTEAAGFLTCGSAHAAAFPMHSISDIKSGMLPVYSDEIVQDLHLFPF